MGANDEPLFVCSTSADLKEGRSTRAAYSLADAAVSYANAEQQSDMGVLEVWVCPLDIFEACGGEPSADDVSHFVLEPSVEWHLV